MKAASNKNLRWQAVVAGVGGQGVLFVTRMLALGAQAAGGRVLISEVHGMAQRGGSVISHLKIGDFAGPLVAMGQADLLLSLDPGEAVRNLGFLRPGGAAVVNAPGPEFLSPEARTAVAAHQVRLVCLDAAGLARAAGAAKGVNLALLAGAAASGVLPFGAAQLKQVVLGASPASRQQVNQRLWQAGNEAV
ncbi:MAG: 2-oxoacid:acceptor oxidoreductase family protein [Desulfarculus sp.]|nr:2-oxoacid:acceptor oxidoreductase family protein [Desulfarculus sp.]